ncbi:MAG: PRC-barrel domain-containing protein [Solirubrobacteraceae bacterium]
MLNVERIEEWRGQEVRDADGEKIGKLEEVYYDAEGGEAMFLSVKSGLLGRHTALVPLLDASVGRDYIRIAYTRAQVEQAERGAEGEVSRNEVRDASAAFALELPDGVEVESASLINERHAQAEQARQLAEELEAEAQRKAAEHADAEQDVEAASARARAAEDDKHQARGAADDARVAAERAERSRVEPSP